MDFESTASNKRKDLECLLQGIDLNSIQLNIDIAKGSRKIKRLFGLICTLLTTGLLCIIFLFCTNTNTFNKENTMKTKITVALLTFMTSNSFSQEISKKVIEASLVIKSSQGRIEIKNPSSCTQYRIDNGSIAFNCKHECKQTTDVKNG